MARTTIAIDDDLLRNLKALAAREGTTLQSVTNALLRRAITPRPATGFRLALKGWEARQQPRVDLLDRDKLLDLMDGR